LDSVTHIVIGAAIGEVALGKKIGRWSMLVGAIAKSLPDFDLFYTGLSDNRAYICHHRGHTHSLFWEAIYALPLAFLLVKIFSNKFSFSRSYIFLLACLWGHTLLDLCTNYGTRLLLPFTNQPYSINTIAIIDLLYTLPMLLLFIIAWFIKNTTTRFKIQTVALIYCFAYLGYTFYNKQNANAIAKQNIQQAQLPSKYSITNPIPLSNELWYVLTADDSMLHVAEYAVRFPNKKLVWHSYPKYSSLLTTGEQTADKKMLQWFGGDFIVNRQVGDTLCVYTTKFGRTNTREETLEKSFVIHYKLFKYQGKQMLTMAEPEIGKEEFNKTIESMWNMYEGK
jgi:inner membrane protein